MTNLELLTILKTLESAETNPIGVYSVRAKLGTKLPYLVVTFGTSDNFFADDKVREKRQNIILELYTKEKNETLEGLVESLLDNNGLPWDKDEAFDDGENFYQNLYYIMRR